METGYPRTSLLGKQVVAPKFSAVSLQVVSLCIVSHYFRTYQASFSPLSAGHDVSTDALPGPNQGHAHFLDHSHDHRDAHPDNAVAVAALVAPAEHIDRCTDVRLADIRHGLDHYIHVAPVGRSLGRSIDRFHSQVHLVLVARHIHSVDHNEAAAAAAADRILFHHHCSHHIHPAVPGTAAVAVVVVSVAAGLAGTVVAVVDAIVAEVVVVVAADAATAVVAGRVLAAPAADTKHRYYMASNFVVAVVVVAVVVVAALAVDTVPGFHILAAAMVLVVLHDHHSHTASAVAAAAPAAEPDTVAGRTP